MDRCVSSAEYLRLDVGEALVGDPPYLDLVSLGMEDTAVTEIDGQALG